MIAMRHLVFGIGLGQTVLTTAVFTGVAILLGMSFNAAIVVGGMVALSSTAVVIKQVSEQGILNTSRAQMGVSILLFQDLAVVPMLILIPLLADGSEGSMASAMAMALLKGTLVVGLLLSAGQVAATKIVQ